MTFQWVPELDTGIDQMDDQHQRIFRALKEMDEAIRAGQGEQVLGRVLSGLALLVVAHFGAEEKLMAQTNFPHLARHRRAHEMVREKVEGMVDRYHEGTLDPHEMMRFMEWWWVEHIRCEDQALADFLKVGEQAG
jgi:hemerythrin